MRPQLSHDYWWTAIPFWPAERSWQVDAIRRVYYDQTMVAGRSVYDERRASGYPREDVLSVNIFGLFTPLGASVWVPPLLSACGISVIGRPSDARLSWLFEDECSYTKRGFVIADIVISWRDNSGVGVLVLEAKTLGEALSPKDIPASEYYARMPSLSGIERRHYRVILDENGCRQALVSGVDKAFDLYLEPSSRCSE